MHNVKLVKIIYIILGLNVIIHVFCKLIESEGGIVQDISITDSLCDAKECYLHLKQNLRRLNKEQRTNALNITIAVVTGGTLSYPEHLLQLNRLYSNGHKLIHYYYTGYTGNDTHPSWYKLKIVYGILKSSLYDYVIWLDSDAAFVDHKISIKELIFLYPGYDLMISKDPPLYECRSLCAVFS